MFSIKNLESCIIAVEARLFSQKHLLKWCGLEGAMVATTTPFEQGIAECVLLLFAGFMSQLINGYFRHISGVLTCRSLAAHLLDASTSAPFARKSLGKQFSVVVRPSQPHSHACAHERITGRSQIYPLLCALNGYTSRRGTQHATSVRPRYLDIPQVQHSTCGVAKLVVLDAADDQVRVEPANHDRHNDAKPGNSPKPKLINQ